MTEATSRGIARLPDPRVWGTLVGAAGGTVFVLANRSDLAEPWRTGAVLLWAAAVLGYVWFVLVVPRTFADPQPVRRSAGLVYLASVAGMLAIIRAGTAWLDENDRTDLGPALIVLAVGLHFLPFAAAFRTDLFRVLGLVLAVLGAAGLVLGLATDDVVAAATAVLAGLTMIVLIAADAARPSRRPAGRPAR